MSGMVCACGERAIVTLEGTNRHCARQLEIARDRAAKNRPPRTERVRCSFVSFLLNTLGPRGVSAPFGPRFVAAGLPYPRGRQARLDLT